MPNNETNFMSNEEWNGIDVLPELGVEVELYRHDDGEKSLVTLILSELGCYNKVTDKFEYSWRAVWRGASCCPEVAGSQSWRKLNDHTQTWTPLICAHYRSDLRYIDFFVGAFCTRCKALGSNRFMADPIGVIIEDCRIALELGR